MKKVLLSLALIAATATVQAQQFRLGLGGSLNNTWLANQNVSDQGDELDFSVTFGGSFGLEALYNFSPKAGISIGFMYTGHNQKYTGEIGNDEFESTTKLRYLDIPVILRITSPSGTYFDFGFQYGALMSADEETNHPAFEGGDVKEGFESGNMAALLGFGVDIEANKEKNVIISIGLRLGYGFSDVTKEYEEGSTLPDNLGLTTLAAHVDDDGDFNYVKTNRIFGGLKLGVSYIFPAKSGSAPASN